MAYTLLYGFLSGFALVLGSFVGIYMTLSERTIALIMAFGSGVLLSALSIDLMNDAFERSHNPLVIGGSVVAGALLFVLGDYLIDTKGGELRKSICKKHPAGNSTGNGSGNAILLGTLLDGIPESFVLGAALRFGDGVGLALVIAILISNFPEGISGTIAMKNQGISNRKIILIWISVMLITLLCTIIGYQFLGELSGSFREASMAFASGAILAMLSDAMLPEAFKGGGRLTGLFVVFGFLVAFLLSKFG